MNKYIYLMFLLVTYLLSQNNTIYVSSVKLASSVNEFEHSFIQQVVNLYNKKNKKNYALKFKFHKTFKGLFEEMRGPKDDKDNYIVVSQLSRSKKRMLEFEISYPYMKSGKVISALNKGDLDFNKPLKLGFLQKTNDEVFVREYVQNKPNISLVGFKSIESQINALKEKKIDLLTLAVSISWAHKFEVVETYLDDDFNSIAVYYKKDSKLKKELDATIQYFVKSTKFYTLIRHHFGDNAVSHYKSFAKL